MTDAGGARRLERIRWRARRGMLENDLLLGRFLERELARLDGEELAALETLLQWDDNDLLDALMGRASSTDGRLAALIERIRAA
jgi:succinate dehydrogenase flavin-adding protein (antitoxin of CptAB toxin-antitoxin module)